jgi:glycosyltransferase involved in cell wall biosynthesis
MQLSRDQLTYLYVGRLSPEKGLQTLIRAFANVRSELDNAKLVLVGSGPQREQLELLVKELCLSSSVEFRGSMDVDRLAEQYASATCLVLPSTSEPWGLVVNEALHYGCPVLVSDKCGCVPELVVDGVTGYAFNTDDIGDLSDKLIRMSCDFGDRDQVAQTCLNQIRTYTPRRAALEILRGCKALAPSAGASSHRCISP